MATKINYKFIAILIIFLIGLYFCIQRKPNLEPFSGLRDCPNLLVKKGKELHLINTKKAMIPGVNPIKFDNLEEYAEYIKWSKKVGIKCPILYYEETYNTQNEKGFRLLDDPLTPSAGLPSNPRIQRQTPKSLLIDANRDDPPFNQNNFSGFDGDDQYVGLKTPLDNINLQDDKGSLTPIDTNWCGADCTNKSIKAGRFEGRIRKR